MDKNFKKENTLIVPLTRYREEFEGELINIEDYKLDVNNKIEILNIFGNTYQDQNDKTVQTVGVKQEDGTYKVDLESDNNALQVLGNKEIVDIYNSMGYSNTTVELTSDGKFYAINIGGAHNPPKVYSLKPNTQYTVQISRPYTTAYLNGITFTTHRDKQIMSFTTDATGLFGMLLLVPTNTPLDFNIYEGLHTEYIIYKKYTNSINMPQPLCKIGEKQDKLYWNDLKGHYYIEQQTETRLLSDYQYIAKYNGLSVTISNKLEGLQENPWMYYVIDNLGGGIRGINSSKNGHAYVHFNQENLITLGYNVADGADNTILLNEMKRYLTDSGVKLVAVPLLNTPQIIDLPNFNKKILLSTFENEVNVELSDLKSSVKISIPFDHNYRHIEEFDGDTIIIDRDYIDIEEEANLLEIKGVGKTNFVNETENIQEILTPMINIEGEDVSINKTVDGGVVYVDEVLGNTVDGNSVGEWNDNTGRYDISLGSSRKYSVNYLFNNLNLDQNNGSLAPNGLNKSTDFIEVNNIKSVVVNFNRVDISYRKIGYYDLNRTFIKCDFETNGSGVISTNDLPVNARFIVVGGYTQHTLTADIEMQTKYEDLNIISLSAQLENIDNVQDKLYWDKTLNHYKLVGGSIRTIQSANGTLSTPDNLYKKLPIEGDLIVEYHVEFTEGTTNARLYTSNDGSNTSYCTLRTIVQGVNKLGLFVKNGQVQVSVCGIDQEYTTFVIVKQSVEPKLYVHIIQNTTYIKKNCIKDISLTDMNERIGLSTYDGATYVSTSNTIKPILKVKSEGIFKDVDLEPNTEYTVRFNAVNGGDLITVDLGGVRKEVNKIDGYINITTNENPSGILELGGYGIKVNDVMVLKGANIVIKYFIGSTAVGEKVDGGYNIEIRNTEELTSKQTATANLDFGNKDGFLKIDNIKGNTYHNLITKPNQIETLPIEKEVLLKPNTSYTFSGQGDVTATLTKTKYNKTKYNKTNIVLPTRLEEDERLYWNNALKHYVIERPQNTIKLADYNSKINLYKRPMKNNIFNSVGADIKIEMPFAEKNIYETWNTDYSGGLLEPTKEYLDGNKKGYINEILGNTVQDSNDLSNVQSVGVWDEFLGGYRVDVVSCSGVSIINKEMLQNGTWGNAGGFTAFNFGKTLSNAKLTYRLRKDFKDFGTFKMYFGVDTTTANGSLVLGKEYSCTASNISYIGFYNPGNGIQSSSGVNKIIEILENNLELTIECDGEKYYPNFTKEFINKTEILLPQPLCKVTSTNASQPNFTDRLYWDSQKGHYCIEVNASFRKMSDLINGLSIHGEKTATNGEVVREFRFTRPSDDIGGGTWQQKGIIIGGLKNIAYNYGNPTQAFCFDMVTNNYNIFLPSAYNTIDKAKEFLVDKEYIGISKATKIIDLPHLNKRIEVGIHQDKTYILSDSGATGTLSVEVPYKKLNPVSKPKNLVFDMSTIQDYELSWDEVREAKTYTVIKDDKPYIITNMPSVRIKDEFSGYVVVMASNDITDAESDELYCKTVPFSPANLSIRFDNDVDGYTFEVTFIDKSEIEDGYTIKYTVDDGESKTLNVPSYSTDEKVSCLFSVAEIMDKIIIQVIAYNDIGENDVIPASTFYVSKVPIWSYLVNEKNVLLSWNDTNNKETEYKVKYSIDKNNAKYDTVQGDLDTIGKEIRHKISLEDTSTMDVSICAVVDGEDHLYSKPLKISKALDKNLLCPSDFNYRWLDKGLIEFSWKDIYDCEDSFEFAYSINNGKEIVIPIDSNTVSQIGKTYAFEVQLESDQSIMAKVRMVWKLNESEYTETLTGIYIPVSGLPPEYIRRSIVDGGIVVEWQPQEYVENYNLHYIQDGKEKIIKTTDNIKKIEINYDIAKQIEMYVKTQFVGGVLSDKTRSMVWTPARTNYDYNEISCKNTTVVESGLGTTCMSKTVNNLVMNALCWNKAKKDENLATTIITQFAMSSNPMELTIYTKNAMSNYIDNMITRTVRTVAPNGEIAVVTYSKTKKDQNLATFLYTKTREDYNIITEINQIRILCFGDSITSGHPGYWAETGTGDPQHCYEYWLDRRLKKAYEIINKGYGSDTTDMMLDRFNKDVIPYNPQFCIIQGGTNDLYWAMAEADGDQVELDKRVVRMKNNIIEMIKSCSDNNIIPVIGTLIPRTGAVGIYKAALYEYNQWIKDYCNSKGIAYVDWFNAGKKNIPSTPLEDPANPGALNPLYDGDAIYDEFGNIIKQGRGIHPNKVGYKIMGDEIPLNIFRTYDTGLKLYLDRDCLQEEKYNDDDKMNPFYTITINDLRLTKTKTLIRYIKNVGVNQSLFSMYVTKKHNVKVEFIDSKGNKFDYVNGLLHSEKVIGVKIDVTALTEDNTSVVDFYLAGREIKFNN